MIESARHVIKSVGEESIDDEEFQLYVSLHDALFHYNKFVQISKNKPLEKDVRAHRAWIKKLKVN